MSVNFSSIAVIDAVPGEPGSHREIRGCKGSPEGEIVFFLTRILQNLQAKPAILDDALSKLSHDAQTPARKVRILILYQYRIVFLSES